MVIDTVAGVSTEPGSACATPIHTPRMIKTSCGLRIGDSCSGVHARPAGLHETAPSAQKLCKSGRAPNTVIQMQSLRVTVPFTCLVLSLAACAGSTPPPATLAVRVTPLELTLNTDKIVLSGDGKVTNGGKPFLVWTGSGFVNTAGQVVIKVDPAGMLWGTGMQKHPHFVGDDRLVAANGMQAMVVADDGTVTLYSGDKPVPGTIKFASLPPDAGRTPALLVIATMIEESVESAKAARPATTPDAAPHS
jgi:hypothetical protein